MILQQVALLVCGGGDTARGYRPDRVLVQGMAQFHIVFVFRDAGGFVYHLIGLAEVGGGGGDAVILV